MLLCLLLPALAGAQDEYRVTVRPEAGGTVVTQAIPIAAVTCGSAVPAVPYVRWDYAGQACHAPLSPSLAGLVPGGYVGTLAARVGAQWSLESLPAAFQVPEPARTCLDGAIAWPVGDGPVVERLANDTTARRAIWAARVRSLRAAGFDVDVLLNSTSVYILATCAE